MDTKTRNARAKMPVNRQIIGPHTDRTRPGTNPALRPETTVNPSGAGIRRGKTSYAGSGKSGYSSPWADSPYIPKGGWK